MSKITVLGLGPGSWKHLTIEGAETLKKARSIFLRTDKHPIAKGLRARGIKFSTFDSLYEKCTTFEEVYSLIVRRLITEAKKCDIVYAVPGNPAVAEDSYYTLLSVAKKENITVLTVPGMSFLEMIYQRLRIDPIKGLQVLDGLERRSWRPDTGKDVIIAQVYDSLTAAEVKTVLMKYYDAKNPVWVIRAAGVKAREVIQKVPLYELDRLSCIDYMTSVYIPASEERACHIEDLKDIMRILRAEGGCPWDRGQDRDSLKPYLLEEAYEVLDAIEKKDLKLLKEELGDLLLQVVFHAEIADEERAFDFDAVVKGICEKLIRRHPHVFGGAEAKDGNGALKEWEASKRKEKRAKDYTGALRDVPKKLPSLMRSFKVQQKASLAGFDWDDTEDVLAKVKEELTELEEVYKTENMNRIKEELGDLLFAVVNLSRFEGIQPEIALRDATDKFIHRFAFMEHNAQKSGKRLDEMTLDQMEELWEMSKMHEYNKNDKK